jgi:hypothetical protein
MELQQPSGFWPASLLDPADVVGPETTGELVDERSGIHSEGHHRACLPLLMSLFMAQHMFLTIDRVRYVYLCPCGWYQRWSPEQDGLLASG